MEFRAISAGWVTAGLILLSACGPVSISSPTDGLSISENRETGGGSVTYQYFVGSPARADRPDTAMASNGDRIEIRGNGFLTVHPKSLSVDGGGIFVHKDAAGTVVASGTWTALELRSFQSYGPGGPQLNPAFRAGKAILRVRLSPAVGGPGPEATLWLGCILPGGEEDDPDDAFEGTRLAVLGGPEFDQIVPFSPTLFIVQE